MPILFALAGAAEAALAVAGTVAHVAGALAAGAGCILSALGRPA